MVEGRPTMYQARFEKRKSIGDGIHILGERDFNDEEEERKEIEELRMFTELT